MQPPDTDQPWVRGLRRRSKGLPRTVWAEVFHPSDLARAGRDLPSAVPSEGLGRWAIYHRGRQPRNGGRESHPVPVESQRYSGHSDQREQHREHIDGAIHGIKAC